MAFAVAFMLVSVAVGSVLFHFMSPWWLTRIASNWAYIDDTINLTFWIGGVGFVAIVLFMAFCVIRFRHRAGRKAAYAPENKQLELWLAMATAGAVVALLSPGLLVWAQFITVPKDASEVEVIGRQWQWSFRLPGADGRLGASNPRYVTSDNNLGLEPNDPNGRDDVVIPDNELHLPLGRPVKVLLRSIDVIHNFDVSEFRAKMDLMPGLVTYFWFEPTRMGTFEILCAAFCGLGHPEMRGVIVVEDETRYRAWLQSKQTFAQTTAVTTKSDAKAKSN